jgi:signal peptidase
MQDVRPTKPSMFETTLSSLKRMNKRQFIAQIFNFLSVVSTAYMIWKGISVYTNCESPIVVVLSESMSPAFERGDILFLSMSDSPILAGDICVFKIEGRDIPIVHRALKVHEKANPNPQSNEKEVFILTKGDHNTVHDRSLYAKNQEWLNRKDLIGRVVGYLPYMGMVTIIMTDYPKFKYAILAGLGVLVLTTRE